MTVSAYVNNYVPSNSDLRQGRADIHFQVLADTTSVLEFTSTINFQLALNIDLTGTLDVNLYSLDVVDNTITLNPWGQADESVLNAYVNNGLKGYIQNGNIWSLFKNKVNLLKLFTEIQHFEEQTTGINIGGKPVANPQIRLFERDLFNL